MGKILLARYIYLLLMNSLNARSSIGCKFVEIIGPHWPILNLISTILFELLEGLFKRSIGCQYSTKAPINNIFTNASSLTTLSHKTPPKINIVAWNILPSSCIANCTARMPICHRGHGANSTCSWGSRPTSPTSKCLTQYCVSSIVEFAQCWSKSIEIILGGLQVHPMFRLVTISAIDISKSVLV